MAFCSSQMSFLRSRATRLAAGAQKCWLRQSMVGEDCLKQQQMNRRHMTQSCSSQFRPTPEQILDPRWAIRTNAGRLIKQSISAHRHVPFPMSRTALTAAIYVTSIARVTSTPSGLRLGSAVFSKSLGNGSQTKTKDQGPVRPVQQSQPLPLQLCATHAA